MEQMEFPIFPLPNVVLFPDALLPLHIFEERYRMMVQDAIEDKKCIGMLLLKAGWEREYFETPPTHEIGCLGIIEAFEKLPNGRFNILLRGLQRFEILRFSQKKPYRKVVARLLDEQDLRVTPAEKMRIYRHVQTIASKYFVDVINLDLEKAEVIFEQSDLRSLIHRLAMILDISARDKQELLEMSSLGQRLQFVQQTIDERLTIARYLENLKNTSFDPDLN